MKPNAHNWNSFYNINICAFKPLTGGGGEIKCMCVHVYVHTHFYINIKRWNFM